MLIVKKIVINNEEDYNKLINKLWLYKYYIFTRFDIVNGIKKEEIDIIRKILNIKKRRERISYIYDEIIKYINEYYKADLCKFENNQCFVQRMNKSNTKYGCCQDCTLVVDNKGCPSSNVSCKLMFCKPALKHIKKLHLKDIYLVNCLSLKQRFILSFSYYSTREQVINDMYYGLLYWGVRSVYKGLRITFFNNKKRNIIK